MFETLKGTPVSASDMKIHNTTPMEKYPMSANLSAIKLLRVMEALRKEAPTLPTQQLHVFLAVAVDNGASQTDIQSRCYMAHTSGGRNIRALCAWAGEGREGLGWLRVEQNPANLRENLLFLTQRGREILDKILAPLE